MINDYDNVEGIDVHTIQPGDANIIISYYAPAHSSRSANDGVIPYGRTIASVEVTVHDSDCVDVTTDIEYAAATVDGDYVLYAIKYPATNGEGLYKIKYEMTLDNSTTILNRVAKRIRAINP